MAEAQATIVGTVMECYYDDDNKGYFLDVEIIQDNKVIQGYVGSDINKTPFEIGATVYLEEIEIDKSDKKIYRHYKV